MTTPNRGRLQECRIIEIPRFIDLRGTLSVIEGKPLLPFDPQRFFYIYGIAEGAQRGCHALKTSQELIIPMAGSFQIRVDDGNSAVEFQLDRPDRGLYVPPLIWHVLHSFSPGSVCGVLASAPYDRDGYYRMYEDFLDAVRRGRER